MLLFWPALIDKPARLGYSVQADFRQIHYKKGEWIVRERERELRRRRKRKEEKRRAKRKAARTEAAAKKAK